MGSFGAGASVSHLHLCWIPRDDDRIISGVHGGSGASPASLQPMTPALANQKDMVSGPFGIIVRESRFAE